MSNYFNNIIDSIGNAGMWEQTNSTYEVPTVETGIKNDLFPSMEAIEDHKNSVALEGVTKPQMHHNPQEDPKATILYVYGGNGSYRIYISANTILESPYFQNKLCKFLDNLKANETVVIELGAMLNTWKHNTMLGNIINAMQRCKGTIVTVASGLCGFSESCLWLFGKQRVISRYGALRFTGTKEFVKALPQYAHYFKYIYDVAHELNVIPEDLDMTTTSKSIMVTRDGVIKPNSFNKYEGVSI